MAYSPFTHAIQNKGESVASKFLLADSNADFEFQDGDKVVFGNGADASISWDNGNSKLQVVPENVAIEIGHASSTTTILGNLTVTGDTTYHNETIQVVENNSIQFEGSTADGNEVILTAADATADRTITLPDVTGHVALLATAATETITSTPAELNILDGVTATATELNYLDITTLGTAAASKAMTWASDSTWTAAGGTCANLGTVTTADINGGTIDGVVIGGSSTAAGSFAALDATTGTFSDVLKTDDTTNATSTTDGSLQTDGGLSVAKDAVIGDDLILLSDSSVIHFGGDKEITLSHVADTGLTLKHTATGDDKPVTLTLATGETDIAADDVIGVVNFQAPDEGTGTDAILVAAGIAAVSEGDFSSSNNATKLSFRTAASEAASEKMSLSSGGNLTVLGDIILDDGGSLKEAGGTAAITFDGDGHVTKIGQDSPSNGEFLKYDGSKWVAAAATVSGLAADDITTGDAAITLATTTGNITIETQANDTDIIFNVDDGGSQITALTLDGSEDGAAIFKSEVKAGTQFATGITNASADVAAGNVKGLVAVTTADTNRTVTLPTDPTDGSTFTIKKVDSGTGHVTVTTSTNNKIDGADSVILYHQNESVTVIFAGSNNYYLV